jgi:hypothetical protein
MTPTTETDDHGGPSSACPQAERAQEALEARLTLDRLSQTSPDCARLVEHMVRHDDPNSVSADLRMGLPVGTSSRTLAVMRDASRSIWE